MLYIAKINYIKHILQRGYIMNVIYLCQRELENEGLFEDNDHRNRFNELMSCYWEYPFFNKGLCKCMMLYHNT